MSSSELESNRELSSEDTKVLTTLSSITKNLESVLKDLTQFPALFFYFYLFLYQKVKMTQDTIPQNLLYFKLTCFSLGHHDSK